MNLSLLDWAIVGLYLLMALAVGLYAARGAGKGLVEMVGRDVEAVHVVEQAVERLAAGAESEDNDLIIATRSGRLVLPRSYHRALATIVDKAGLPRLTSHGLRHTAATHMVQSSSDLGGLRAIADLLGHSPEMLMNAYAHALPNSQAAVVDRLRRER